MTTISPHTTRAPGTILTATIYNFDHGNHIANATALNNGKVEGAGSVVDGSVAVFDGVSGSALRSGGGAPVLSPVDTADISDDAVSNAKLANMAAASVKGRAAGAGTGDPQDLTFLQIAAIGRRFENINSGYTVQNSDRGVILVFTGSSGTVTFPAAASLGADWYCYMRCDATVGAVLDPDGSEQIDDLTTWTLYPEGMILVRCGGTNFRTDLITPMRTVFTANDTFVKPGCGSWADIEGWGSGAAGGRGGANNGGGGGGGGQYKHARLPLSAFGTTETVTIGALVAGHTTGTTGAGANGNNTTLGSLFTAFAGGGGGMAGTRGGGGGGGGGLAAGAQSTSDTGGAGGSPAGGAGGAANTAGTSTDGQGGAGGGGAGSANPGGAGGSSNEGGAGGGGGSDAAGNGGAGGSSIKGGAGGGGGTDQGTAGAAGTSQFGGNGGIGATGATNAGDGVAPGGGGGGAESGTSGDGARGEMRITIS